MNKFLITIFILGFLFSSNELFAWTAPLQAFPNNGTINYPINTGASAQTKAGPLWAYFFGSNGTIKVLDKLAIGIPKEELTSFQNNPNLQALVKGKVGATEYCTGLNPNNCINATNPGLSSTYYESEWTQIGTTSTNNSKIFNTNLGTLDMLIYVEASKSATTSASFGTDIHQINFGGDNVGTVTTSPKKGFYWTKPETAPGTVVVYRMPGDTEANYIRVKAWKIDASSVQDIVIDNTITTSVNVPVGIVIPFALSSCPTVNGTWQEVVGTQGRYIIGATSTVGAMGGDGSYLLKSSDTRHSHGYKKLTEQISDVTGYTKEKVLKRAETYLKSLVTGKDRSDSTQNPINLTPAYQSVIYCKKISN